MLGSGCGHEAAACRSSKQVQSVRGMCYSLNVANKIKKVKIFLLFLYVGPYDIVYQSFVETP